MNIFSLIKKYLNHPAWFGLVYPPRPIRIELKENPSTGYRWYFKNNNPPDNLLKDDYVTVRELADDDDLVGGSGTRVFEFARTPCKIIIERKRIFEPDTIPPVETFSLEIT